jgi:serine/threonine protein kinase/tetratricopeptide (TPR) repeat protein
MSSAASPADFTGPNPPDPSAPAPGDAPQITEGPGSRIGPYKLLQQIGEGGMGAVYMAEQEHPVRRRVALKIIKPGMDSKQVIARFEAERQALALMDHLNIAHVLDAGTTETGRPFFVMELVHGVPLTRYCDENRLTPRQRLELFVPVCQAIQHAHQKGIIHRDLKPSNILVTLYDGRPVPKIIDFGLAKATDQRLTERTMFTQYGTIVGTFEYMAPEQAEMSALGVDTRSDIYSLGVLLYELLTGTTPLQRKRLREAALTEALRLIKEEEPEKPSARLSHSGQALATVAAARKTEPARLARLVRGELDWIVMKCLEKDRTRRYETANGLARDIERHLHDEPVEACPPSAGYRLRKLARKYKKAVGVAAVFLALLLGGVVVSTAQAVRASRAEARAVAERDAAQQARERADRNFALAKDAVEKYLSKVTDNPRLTQANFHQLRKELLETAMPFFQKLVEQVGQDPELRAARGQAYLRLGALRGEMGDWEAARADSQQALEIFELLVAEFPALPQYRQDLAQSHYRIGFALHQLGRWAEAEAQYRQALPIREKLAADFKAVHRYRQELALSHNNLGILLADLDRMADAATQYRQALSLREKLAADSPTTAAYHRDVAGVLNNLANVLRRTGKRTEALALYGRAIRSQEQALQQDSQEATSRRFLGKHRFNLATLLAELGRSEEAETQCSEAVAIWDKLITDFPDVQHYVADRAQAYFRFGDVLRDNGRPQDALDWYARSVATLESLLAKEKRLAEARVWLRQAHEGRARALDVLRRHAEAVQDWKRALELDDGRHRRVRQLGRAISQAHLSGDHRRALAAAAVLAKDADGLTLEWLARLCALASAVVKAADLREQYASRAVQLLRQAAGKGHQDGGYLKEGTDLAPLRRRADFQKLLAEGEAKRETPGP